jgi:hypothetical protein
MVKRAAQWRSSGTIFPDTHLSFLQTAKGGSLYLKPSLNMVNMKAIEGAAQWQSSCTILLGTNHSFLQAARSTSTCFESGK